jgi:hypothetical protein
MKQFYTLVAALLLTTITFSQTPEKMSYQAVIRDASDALVQSQPVGMQISILQGSNSGTSVYKETQTPSTNVNGLVSIEIGTGTTTDDFSIIDWSASTYFIEISTDLTGGTNYNITVTSQLLSVPYALQAKNAESIGTCGLSIGDTYQGGIIFYLDATGCHGLIAAPSDQSTGAQWFGGSYTDTKAYGSGLFEGKYNSLMIMLSQLSVTSAAGICDAFALGGSSDWYLPSIIELDKMYQNIGQGNTLGLGNIGGFVDQSYWSSTELSSATAISKVFDSDGMIIGDNKSASYYVRAVRAF